MAISSNVKANRRTCEEYCKRAYSAESYAMMPFSAFRAEFMAGRLQGGVTVGVVCSGTMKITINGRHSELHRDAIFLLNEESRVESAKYSKACSGYVVCFSRGFLERMDVNVSDLLAMRALLGSRSCLVFSAHDISHLHNITTALSKAVEREDNPYNAKIVSSLFSAFFYTLISLVSAYADNAEVRKNGARSKSLFDEFLRLLVNECEKERSVEYYAARLKISPKYLSVICRKQVGKSASTVIDEAVIRHAKELLSQSGLSVRDVVEKMNFTTQSFFGKYFKQRVGVSPSRYKVQEC